MTTAPPTDSPPTDWIGTREAGRMLCGQTAKTVRNHMVIGTKLPSGWVRLKYQWLKNKLYTRPCWVAEYLETIRRATEPRDDVPATRRETPDQQAKRFAREKAEADRMFARKRKSR